MNSNEQSLWFQNVNCYPNCVWNSCWIVLFSIIKCSMVIMTTLSHRNLSTMFLANYIHHSCFHCAEKWTRVCETKKTKLFGGYRHQNTGRFNNSENFFCSRDSIKCEESKNRIRTKIWQPFGICWFKHSDLHFIFSFW